MNDLRHLVLHALRHSPSHFLRRSTRRLPSYFCLGGLALAVVCVFPMLAFAHTATFGDIDIVGNYDNAVGSSDAASQGVIGGQILDNRPLLRPGEMLEYVPGMVVTQHSGDGKANQYFLRGFNLDHGTDFATTLNGMPINLPTNAHGQGYSDLNFLIPELVQRIDYRKGPYFAQDGDFASAGAADFTYKTRLDQDFTQLTLGQRGYRRFVGAASQALDNGMTSIAALERLNNDGPWTVPEGLRKQNGVFMLSDGSRANGWTASLMGYSAHWTSTDQVPLDLIASGQNQGQPFGRFDSLDPSDGGHTSRSSLSLDWRRTEGQVADRVMAYAIDYNLGLFSDFTYYAMASNPPSPSYSSSLPSDQFMQAEHRNVYGLKASRQWDIDGAVDWLHTLGFQTRSDVIDLSLAHTQSRQFGAWIRQDRVRENLTGVYGESQARWNPWLRTSIGLRYDQYTASVDSLLNSLNSGQATASKGSPKFTLVLGPWQKTEYFFNAGRGFHSNDARGTTATVDPNDGSPVGKVPGLVSSRGYELGVRTEALAGLQSSLSLWRLNFDSELVYSGDDGGTEAGRPSTRTGVEWNNHWTPNARVLFDADLAWTRPRYSDADPVGAYIPNAVQKVGLVALTVKDVARWNLTAQVRYIGSAALIEDDSVRSASSTVVNFKARRRLDHQDEVYVDVINVFNRTFNDIAYDTTGMQTTPTAPVLNGVQVHPGEPRTVRVTCVVRY